MSSSRTAQRSAATPAQLTTAPVAPRWWVVDDAGEPRWCTAHPRRPCRIGGRGAEHAVCPSGAHTLCARNVDWLVAGSDAHPRSGVWLTSVPSWPRSRRCVECVRRLVTAGVVEGPGDRHRNVCAVCRYTIPADERRPMAWVRSSAVRSVLGMAEVPVRSAPSIAEMPGRSAPSVAEVPAA